MRAWLLQSTANSLLLACLTVAAWSLQPSAASGTRSFPGDSLTAAPVLTIAGSGTVFPVAEAWRDLLATNYSYTVEPGGSSTGARRVCKSEDDPEHVMIGMMSRDWRTTEAERMDDGYTLECLDRTTGERSGRRVTQLMVGVDGVAMVLKANGSAHECVTHPDVGGLTTAQLRWIFSDWTTQQLVEGPYGNIRKESVIPNDNDNGIKEWSDISPACAQVPINPYGTGSQSGTTDLVTGVLFNGEVDEEYMYCNMSQVTFLETLPPDEMASYIQNHRDLLGPPNCYVPSEIDDYDIIRDWLLADAGGIAYVPYAFYTKYPDLMTRIAIGVDPEYGIQDTEAAVILPTRSSIIDGSYNSFTRNLFVNVANTAWEVARSYLLNGYSSRGLAAVDSVGYVAVNEEIRARMLVICKQGSNPLADYVSIPPDRCWNGTELVSFPYINFAGNRKENFTCQACPTGSFKRSNAATTCDQCEPGTMSARTGASACELCLVGGFANESSSTSCTRCSPGSVNAIPGSTSCEACQAGHFQSVDGESRCQACPPGKFQQEVGASFCLACGVGTFATLEGSLQCTPCEPGHFQGRAAANSSCLRCPKGTYSTSTASSACSNCLDGLTTQYVGAYDISHCVCTGGSFMPMLDEGGSPSVPFPCKPCPAGMDCPEGSSYSFLPGIVRPGFQCPEDEIVCNYPLVKPGHMTIAAEPLKVYKCVNEDFCPGRDPGLCAYLRDPEEVGCGSCLSSAYKTGSECKPCGDGPNTLILVFAAVGLVVALGAAAFAVNKDVLRQSNATIATAIVAGLAFGGLQTLGVLHTMNLAWFEPMQSVMEFATVLGLDFSVLRMSCQLGSDPVVNYLFRQMVAPGLVPLVFVLLLIKKKLFRKSVVMWVELMNTVGAVYSILFISVVISALTPVVCYDHPGDNGSSVVGMSAVLCFEDADWWGLLAIGCTSLSVVTVPFLALCGYAIWCYQHFLASSNVSMLKAFQFLFVRFRAEAYYYGGLLLLRNFMIPCIPAMIRSDVIFQLMFMSVTVLGFSYLQVFLQPWRTVSVNLFDMCLALYIMLILICGTASSNLSTSEGSFMVLGTAIFVSACMTVLGFFAWLIINRFMKRKLFDAFICHHKLDAAAQSRYLKMCLTQTGNLRVFIDSDDLLHLDGLFQVVRESVGKVVVYLTRQTLSRPWCCGEIVTAHINKIPTALVLTESFVMPAKPYTMEQCEELFNLDDSCLMNFGMTAQHVQAAFQWLLWDEKNPRHELSFTGGRKKINILASELFEQRKRSLSSPTLARKASVEVASGSLVVSSDPGDDEASATAGILMLQVQDKIAAMGHGGVVCLCDFEEEGIDQQADRLFAIVDDAMANVFILTPGSLQSIVQLRVMMMAEACGSFNKSTIPVTTPYFTFPTEAFYTGTLPKLAKEVSDETAGDALVSTVRALFKIIAVTYATASSRTLLYAQAMEVIRRVPAFNPSDARGSSRGSAHSSDEIVARRSSASGTVRLSASVRSSDSIVAQKSSLSVRHLSIKSNLEQIDEMQPLPLIPPKESLRGEEPTRLLGDVFNEQRRISSI